MAKLSILKVNKRISIEFKKLISYLSLHDYHRLKPVKEKKMFLIIQFIQSTSNQNVTVPSVYYLRNVLIFIMFGSTLHPLRENKILRIESSFIHKKILSPFTQTCIALRLVEIGPVALEKTILNFVNIFFRYIFIISP